MKCHPVWYAVLAVTDVLWTHPPAQSDHNYDNWSNGEYGNNSDDCDIDSGWFKKIKQLSLIQF